MYPRAQSSGRVGIFAPVGPLALTTAEVSPMPAKITPRFVELAYEGALKSYWRKAALRTFLRDSHISEAHLATWYAG
jgi:hypothetical protein